MRRFLRTHDGAFIGAAVGIIVFTVVTGLGLMLANAAGCSFLLNTVTYCRNDLALFAVKSWVVGVLLTIGCGLILGRANRRTGIIAIASFLGILACGIVALWGGLSYTFCRWPTPQPYPGAWRIQSDLTDDPWGVCLDSTYAVTLSIDTVQHYYETQMPKYCTGDWRFEFDKDAPYSLCREATCDIPHPWRKESFTVQLCPIGDIAGMNTRVIQSDCAED